MYWYLHSQVKTCSFEYNKVYHVLAKYVLAEIVSDWMVQVEVSRDDHIFDRLSQFHQSVRDVKALGEDIINDVNERSHLVEETFKATEKLFEHVRHRLINNHLNVNSLEADFRFPKRIFCFEF